MLRVEGETIRGELALDLSPGTPAASRDRAVDRVLGAPLAEVAAQLGVVLAAAPSAYAFPLPGKDDAGRTRFEVRGRVEGERIVPERPGSRARPTGRR